jgi:Uma2 family endonuclease
MATEIERARRLFTVDEYDRMVEAGIFGPEDRLELINGEIVEMSPIGLGHASCVANLNRILVTRLVGRAVVWPQNPVTVLTHSKPQPDVTLLRTRSYRERHPDVNAVFLLIEVADTSLVYDRRVKLALYARGGVPEYWIVDTEAESVETFQTPTGDGYRDTRRITRDGIVAPAAFPDLAISVAELFA